MALHMSWESIESQAESNLGSDTCHLQHEQLKPHKPLSQPVLLSFFFHQSFPTSR